MATFMGTSDFNLADAENSILVGFSGGTTAELQDSVGDTFFGSDAQNFVTAGPGDDIINGGASSDLINGGDGDDRIDPGTNVRGDVVEGSSGSDTIVYSSNGNGFQSLDYAELGEGIVANFDAVANRGTVDKGVFGTDTIIDIAVPVSFNSPGLLGGLRIAGTNHADAFDIRSVDNGFLAVFGGDGIDTYNFQGGYVRLEFLRFDTPTSVSIDLSANTVLDDGYGNRETFAGRVNEVSVGNGNDTVIGTVGDDRFILGAGDDYVDGGAGFDRVRYDRFTYDGVSVDLGAGIAQGTARFGPSRAEVVETFTDTLVSIEWVRGSNGNDSIVGSAADERLSGRDGLDTLRGRGGDDVLLGGDGRDTLGGGSGADALIGGRGGIRRPIRMPPRG